MACNVLLVDLTLWSVLYPHAKADGDGNKIVNYDSLNAHAFNFLWLQIEFWTGGNACLMGHYELVPWKRVMPLFSSRGVLLTMSG